MSEDFWLERWQTNQLNWHKDAVNPNLVAHIDALTAGPSGEPRRILIPLCGKTVDLTWLADAGHQAVGVEIIELAAQRFFAERSIEPEVTKTASGHPRYAAGGVEIIVADFFDVTADDVGAIDGAWDRAALVALPPELRGRYAEALMSITAGPILLNAFSYDQTIMDGPPFSVEGDEVRRLFADRSIEQLSHEDVIDSVAFKERGHLFWFSTVYLIA